MLSIHSEPGPPHQKHSHNNDAYVTPTQADRHSRLSLEPQQPSNRAHQIKSMWRRPEVDLRDLYSWL
jgi:hypothetical protein